jgi:hypothetical protein
MKGLSSLLPERVASIEEGLSNMLNPQLTLENGRAILSFPQVSSKSLIFQEPVRCSFLLLDEKGRVRLEETHNLQSADQMEISLPKLSAGTYNAWIKIGGKSYIRQLIIEGPKRSSWLKRLGLPF